MAVQSRPLEIQFWPIDRLVLYARNPRKNDAVVDRMCSSIREFGFKIPVLARSDGEVVDGHGLFLASKRYGPPHRPLLKGLGSIVTVFSVLNLVRQALALITVGLVLGMADR